MKEADIQEWVIDKILNAKFKKYVVIIVISIIFLEVLTISVYQSYGEEFEIEFTQFVVSKDGTGLRVQWEGKAPDPESVHMLYLYDKDGDGVIASSSGVEKDGTIRGSWGTSVWGVDNGIGYVEVYDVLDVWDAGNKKPDVSKRLLLQKVNIQLYEPKRESHTIKIENEKFIPNNITINLGDKIEFQPDCDDCYKLESIQRPPTQYQGGSVSLHAQEFSGPVGIYKIADIFNPNMILTINVVYPDLTTSSQSYGVLEPNTETKVQEKLVEIEKIANENEYSSNQRKWVTSANIEPEPKTLGIASFVDKSKDPKYYIDRYKNESSYKEWFDENYPQYDSIEQAVGLELTEKIPRWIKNIFGWYVQDQVSENELLNAIKYLISKKILIVN